MPRDFFQEAEGYLSISAPVALQLEHDREKTIGLLLDILPRGSVYERKYAAFALGQIGDPATLALLRESLESEKVGGVAEAIAAAVTGIERAGIDTDKSEVERRQLIEDAYEGRVDSAG